MKRKIALLFAALVLLCFLPGCGQNQTGYFVRYDLAARPRTLDPQLATSSESLLLVENTFEGLLRQGAEGELVPGVATGYDVSEDGKTYTFHLRQDAAWNDGRPVTAKDFVFGFQRVVNPSTGAAGASGFVCIRNARAVMEGDLPVSSLGVRAQDDYTFVVTLESATPFFLGLTASAAAMPCNEDFFNATKGRYGAEPKYLLFNGPFYIKGYDEKRITLRFNAQYSSARPTLAGGVNLFYQFDDRFDEDHPNAKLQTAEEKVLDRLRTGKVDAAPVAQRSLQSLVEDKKLDTFSFENTVWGLQFNCGSVPFENEKLRRAFRMVIDTAELNAYYQGGFAAANAVVPPAIKLLDRSYRDVAGGDLRAPLNREQARVLFAEGLAELGQQQLGKVTIHCPAEGGFAEMMGVVQRQLRETLGVFVNLEPLPQSELNAAVAGGNYDLALVPLAAGANSPDNILSRFSSLSAQNRAHYNNPDYDNLLQRAAQSTTVTESVMLYTQAERLLMEETAFLPIAFETSYYACAEEIEGLIFSPFSYQVFFKYAYEE